MRRPHWRPNILPGTCKAPSCELDLAEGDGLILPRPTCLRDTLPEKVLLCRSHTLETAPTGNVGTRYKQMNAYPDHDLLGVVRPEGLELSPSDYQLKGAMFMARHWAGLISDDKGLGKQNAIDTLVATPSGWREIGSIRIGNFVIGSTGKPTRVEGVFPQGIKPSYRVHLSSGANVEAGLDHLWGIDYWRGGRTKARIVLTTQNLLDRGRVEGVDLSKTQLYCPTLSGPIEFAPVVALPLEPYALGALIANGCLGSSSTNLTYGTQDWTHINVKLGALDIGEPRTLNPGGTTTAVGVRGIRPLLRTLGLAVRSAHKRIPRIYQRGTPVQRIALLHGLMDADGSISKTRNKIVYHTVSGGLAMDVRELVQGLGGIATVRRYDRGHEGKPVEFQVRVRVPEWVSPFSLPRKLDRYKPGNRARPTHSFRDVEYVRDVESVCIKVEAPDGLFVTEHCILTHNTGQALLAIPEGVGVIVVCPSSCKSGWYDETLVWRPDLRPVVLEGRNAWTEPGGPRADEVYIINYDILPPRVQRCRCNHLKHEHPNGQALLKGIEEGKVPNDHPGGACLACTVRGVGKTRFKCSGYRWTPPTRAELRGRLQIRDEHSTILIADEVHHVKRSGSEKTKRFRELRRACDRAWGLSASPLENNEKELQGVYESLGIFEAAFGTPKKFHALFKRSRETKKTPSGPARDEIRERRSWVELGRTAKQVGLQLPPIRFEDRRVTLKASDLAEVERLMGETIASKRTWDAVKAGDLEDPSAPDASPMAQAEFDEARALYLLVSHTEDDVIDAIKRVIELGPRAKIGPEMSRMRKALAAFKIPTIIGAFVEEVESASTPGIVFSAHRAPVETIGTRDGWGEISGRKTPRQRKRTLAEWKAGKLVGLAGTIRACGEGLNLHQAGKNRMCGLVGFVDLDFTPEKNDQAARRIYRRGQTIACLITSYVADHSLDRHVARLIDVKKRLIEAITITGGL